MKSFRIKSQVGQFLIDHILTDQRAAEQHSMMLCLALYFDKVSGGDLTVHWDQFKTIATKLSQLVSVLHCLSDAFQEPIFHPKEMSVYSLLQGKPRPWKQTQDTEWLYAVNGETKCTSPCTSSLVSLFFWLTMCLVLMSGAYVPVWWDSWHITAKHYSYN